MRNNFTGAMLRMPSLLESRNCLLHLWTSLWRKWSQSKFSPMATGCSPIPHYVMRKGRHRGARHGRTEAQKEHFIAHNARRRCLKKKLKEFTIAPKKTQHIVIRSSKLAGLKNIEWVRQKRAYATSTRFLSCSLSQKLSSSWVWRRGCTTNFTTAVLEMALFLKRFLVGHVWLELVDLAIFFLNNLV